MRFILEKCRRGRSTKNDPRPEGELNLSDHFTNCPDKFQLQEFANDFQRIGLFFYPDMSDDTTRWRDRAILDKKQRNDRST